jgi:DNA-binding CsgD family transcriptional regulator
MRAPQQGDAERVASLSEKQLTSLRLTYLHQTSKEIAKHAGVTPYAIDAQIERAKQRLGVSTRIEAAELVMRHSPGPYEQLIYGSPPVAPVVGLDPQTVSPDDPARQDEVEIAEQRSVYAPPSSNLTERITRRSWGRPDDLSPFTRAWLIPAAAFLILAIVFTLLTVGEQASQWASKVLPAYQNSR